MTAPRWKRLLARPSTYGWATFAFCEFIEFLSVISTHGVRTFTGAAVFNGLIVWGLAALIRGVVRFVARFRRIRSGEPPASSSGRRPAAS